MLGLLQRASPLLTLLLVRRSSISTRRCNAVCSNDALSYRVREALLDAEEQPYTVWSEGSPRPLKVNLDLLTWRARLLSRENRLAESQQTYKRCIELDPLDGRAFLGLSRLQVCEWAIQEQQRCT